MHVISTAGHVDHGKSTLVQRLTGIDPDRLAEEKERGLTIDLGFAWLTTPGGREIGIVDVPGHERFIHNMLAGVGPITVVLFVVDVNEGWMPQSEEHLAILDLLGARAGVVALTKCDLVDEARIHDVAGQIRGRLAGTVLDGSQIVAVSGATGAGCQELLVAIDRILERVGDAEDTGRPRVFVDRVFTVKGVGTVVTGTLTGGSLRVDDVVTVLPAGHVTRVRGIQTHRRILTEATPLSRVALNLVGLERAELRRGDAVVVPGGWRATTAVDVSLKAAAGIDHEIRARGAYKVHVGAAELDARLTLHEGDALRPGTDSFGRLTLLQPVVVAPQDRFVLRDPGRRATVAGGVILDAHPPGIRGDARTGRIDQLRARAAATIDDMPTLVVEERGVVTRTDLAWLAGSDAAPSDAVALRTLEVSNALFEGTITAIEGALAAFHERQPLVRGMPREEAREAAGIRDQRLFAEVIDATHRVVADGTLLRLPMHKVTLTLEQSAAREILLRQLLEAGFSPPSLSTLMETHGEPLVRALIDAGELVRIAPDIAYSSHQLEAAKARIAEAIDTEGPLTAARIKQLLGTSRKYAIPLLEHLDDAGFTRRRGDVRELIG